MKRVFIFLFYIPVVLFASFFEEEDPMHYYHVNVLTGHLNLHFQDVQLKSPVPFSLTRSYTSAGALERTPDGLDLVLKELKDSAWMFQGGWSFLSHANLFIYYDKLFPQAYLCEKGSSNLTPYYQYKNEGKDIYLQPQSEHHWASGNLSSRKRVKKNVLKIYRRKAHLYLPDGSERYYSGDSYDLENCWRLNLEILPSKHRVVYHYRDKKKKESQKLSRIELQNPQGTKTFASIDFDHSSYKTDRKLHARTSEGKNITYQMLPEFKERTYLEKVESPIRSKETVHYQPGRKGIGARLGAMSFGGKEQFRVEYYLPESKQQEKKWERKYNKKHLKGDKVKSLKLPDPETGQFVDFAQFFYFPEYTEVKDREGAITRFFHDEEKLLSTEYYGKEGHLHSRVEFTWDEDDLTGKRMLDDKGHVLFSKSFTYDDEGNVIEEVWQDHVTGCPPICRKFSYSETRLVLFEEEVGGLSHKYEYLPTTDLLTKKLTLDKGKIVLREFFSYNKDNLLIRKMVDDGRGEDSTDLTGVTERKIENFVLDPITGLCRVRAEFYLELNTLKEQVVLSHFYAYNEKREVVAETVTYGPNKESYTTYMEYDEYGRLAKQTTPLGRENTFTYDELGNLLESKEVGAPKKTFTYDCASRPRQCIENGKTTQSIYDIKGRLLAQTDRLGNTIHQVYDCFGRCVETHFPEALNAEGNPYLPVVTSSYDTQGNLSTYTNPRGETTTKTYNALRKPIQEEYPDGTTLRHFYNQDGTISKTIQPDQTEVHFTYDSFQRMTSKIILSAKGQILSEETWTYNAFHLLSYTDSLGLTTHYQYDGMGRKIAENAEGRTTTYAYDALGYLERISQGGCSKVQLHNVEGEIIEQWEEDSSGKVENHMFLFYNSEGRKERAIRITSQGEAEDHFFYDEEGRLCKHINPEGETSQFLFSQVTNSLGQTVDQKTTIDPLGNAILETYDANGRTASIEKRDPDNHTVANEQLFYDEAGNKAKRVVAIYEKNAPLRTYTTTWQHDERGRPLKEIEEGKKCTTFAYDAQGRLTEKTLPSGVTLSQSYDGVDRLLEIKSSDGSIHYTYTYGKGNLPLEAEDKIHHFTWKRTYNLFGEITSETRPDGSSLYWNYDNRGRRTELTLPDHSLIQYSYTDLHLASITRYSSSGEAQYTHSYTQFDENGHVCEEELIHNLGTVTTTHDLLERVESQQTPWNTASLAYGPSGLVMKTENSLFKKKEYAYDPLNQLLKEGDQNYSFDSLGNPLDVQVNQFNQIVSTPHCSLFYNDNGNPIRQHASDQIITYGYDALNRLTTLHYVEKKHIHYTYDPFARLYSKETYLDQNSFFSSSNSWSREVIYFLYDGEHEIGTMDQQNTLCELKVLGLGILGDIGGAVALELRSEVFAPLHDFTGNVIALVTSKGRLREKCDIDAFGKVIPSTTSLNPWRFHSKRTEEHLVFFGNRFYDPNLGRWLTPDPAGSLESPNLYLYVRNSPLNRLDLFGLESEEIENFSTEVSIFPDLVNSYYAHCIAHYGEIQADWVIYSNQFHKLQFSSEELQAGKIDILDHFHELLPKEGMAIGLTTYQNGIKNQAKDFGKSASSVLEKVPGDGIFIAMYTPTRGLWKDISSTLDEKFRVRETPEAIVTRQAMTAFVETLEKVNPKLLWFHVNHSRAGATGCAAIEGMSDNGKKLLERKMLWFGVAPAEPLAKEMAIEARNVYSTADCITGPYGEGYQKMEEHLPEEEKMYDIKFLPYDTLLTGGHGFRTKSYQKALKDKIKEHEKKYGFYKANR